MKTKSLLLLVLVSIVSFNAFSQDKKEMDLTEQLINGAIRIVGHSYNGDTARSSTGTGFFFNFYDSASQKSCPVIITTKHLVTNYKYLRLYLKNTKDDEPDNSKPLVYDVTINSKTVLEHPEKDVDLVAIPIDPIIKEYEKKNIVLYIVSYYETDLLDERPQKKGLKSKESEPVVLKSVEDVLTIGYPNGVWDSVNTIPLVRKGITATPPKLDYNGRKEFLIDLPLFPGLSGAPVILFSEARTKKADRLVDGSKLYLLGILYRGVEYPASNTSLTKSAVSSNVGDVIKASKILGFKKVLFLSK